MAFQAALAAGAPLGKAAWGGTDSHLTTGQRIGSAISVLFYLAAIALVRGRAAGRIERRYRWGTWALAAVLALSALANVASSSAWEHYLLAPVAVALSGLCVVVARTAARSQSQPRARSRRWFSTSSATTR
jgi:uncharacterized membrane protein YoaK (UPF0700 family)